MQDVADVEAGGIAGETAAREEPARNGAPPGSSGTSRVREALLRSRTSVEQGLVSEEEYLAALAERTGSFVLPEPPPAYLEPVTDRVPVPYLEEFLVVPLFRDHRDAVWIAVARELDPGTRRELERVLDAPLQTVLAPESMVLDLIASVYRGEDGLAVMEGTDLRVDGDGAVAVTDDVEELANQAPVVRLVNFILQEAFRKRASDVHVESMEDELRVRYRIDGALHDITQPPKKYQAAVVSRIKLLADLDVTERRRPQDGRIRMQIDGRPVDLRVSTIPTLHGESVVMRILDKESIRLPLEDLGFAPGVLSRFRRLIRAPHGVVLVTGPTGSGKTTTQYAALAQRNEPDVKILTVEDPVEYHLGGINQMAVKPAVGLTFARALRSLLRQDPDILMVGEMRDRETAEIAVQAALTGHLVFSTLHTNDAAGGVTRLLEMGVEDYLVAATVRGILAQRLVRTVCSRCVRSVEPHELDGAVREHVRRGDGAPLLRRGRGCEACDGTGYRGRTGIFELLELGEGVRSAVAEGAGTEEVRRLARDGGMRLLWEDGLEKVRRGVTTFEEVARVAEPPGAA